MSEQITLKEYFPNYLLMQITRRQKKVTLIFLIEAMHHLTDASSVFRRKNNQQRRLKAHHPSPLATTAACKDAQVVIRTNIKATNCRLRVRPAVQQCNAVGSTSSTRRSNSVWSKFCGKLNLFIFFGTLFCALWRAPVRDHIAFLWISQTSSVYRPLLCLLLF